jgi:hypothetical protein
MSQIIKRGGLEGMDATGNQWPACGGLLAAAGFPRARQAERWRFSFGSVDPTAWPREIEAH